MVPGYNRAELSAELTVVPSWEGSESPQAQTEAARRAAAESGLAHESGPGAMVLAGGRAEVLDATRTVIERALDAGAHIVEVKVEHQGDAPRFHALPTRLTAAQAGELSEPEFVRRFGAVCEHSPWVAREVYRQRPFAGFDALAEAFARAVRQAPPDRQLELVRAHPELGGREAEEGSLTQHSTGEQASAGLHRMPAEQAQRLRELNGAYRERFGFPLVIAVRGRDSDSILAEGRQRLEGTRQQELERALAAIGEIARLRLHELVEDNERKERQ